jgi:hypothetical protein
MRDDSGPSDNVEILAMGRCSDDHYFLELRIVVGGRRRRHVLSLEDFEAAPDRVIASLEAGLVTPSSRADFRRRVQEAVRTLRPTFRVVTRPGWYGRCFVLPSGEVFGDEPNLRVCLPEIYREFGEKFASRGTLRGWRRIAELAVGNPALIIALAHAFTGPVVALLGVEAPGIQLVGEPGGGKSGIAEAVASVWCGREGTIGAFLETWNQTKHTVEKVAAAHSASLLILDDTRLFERFDRKGFANFREAIMRAGGGRMKRRWDDVGDLIRFRTPVLSISNDSLDKMAGDVGVEIDDALRDRLIDIPLPDGVKGAFEELHGCGDYDTLATELLRLAGENYGVASVEFIERIVEWRERDAAGLIASLKARREAYLTVAKRRVTSASRRLARIHHRFATIYAAAALAIEFGILPWDRRTVGKVIIACELAHVNFVEGNNASVVAQLRTEDPFEALKDYVRDHGASFIDLRGALVDPDGDHDHATCAGYVSQGRGGLELLLSEAKLQEVCGGKAGALRAKAQLDAAGWLVRDGARPSTRRTIWARGDNKREQVIAIRAEAFPFRISPAAASYPDVKV